MEPIAICTPAKGTLESAMNMLVQVFQCHARLDGNKLHLSRGEMRDLFQRELCDLMQASRDPHKSFVIISDLDQNQDGKVDFEEFVSVATRLTMCSHSYFDEDGGRLMCGYR